MKKIILFFLALFAVNFIFSQGLDYLMLESSQTEDMLAKMPKIDQIRLERYFQQKNPCPKPCPQKPVSSGHRPPKPKPATPPEMINIVNGTPGSVFVGSDGTVRVESYPVLTSGTVKMRVDTVYLLPNFGKEGIIPLMPGNPSVEQNQFMFIWLLIGGLVTVILLALSGRLSTRNQMH